MSAVVHIVDDDPDVRKALARLLSTDGFEVAVSGSTQEFLDQYDPRTTGCIVLDLSMPGMDGLQLQAALAERGAAHPVIFLTGCGDIASSVRAMKAGAIDFLTKPVDVDALLEAVKRGIVLDDDLRHRDHEREDAQALFANLTPRERELVPYLGDRPAQQADRRRPGHRREDDQGPSIADHAQAAHPLAGGPGPLHGAAGRRRVAPRQRRRALRGGRLSAARRRR